jgi:hypothetical protein
MKKLLLASVFAIASVPSYAQTQREKASPGIEAQAPPNERNRPTYGTPEEICNSLNREDGSWWHCMINEYKKLPCDVACQLSIHDR